MARKLYTEATIQKVLADARDGMPAQDVIARHGISQATFYRWCKRFGLEGAKSDPQVATLKAENEALKKLLADMMLKTVLQRPHAHDAEND